MEFCRSTCLARPLATAQALAVSAEGPNLTRLGSVGRFIIWYRTPVGQLGQLKSKSSEY